MMSPQALRGQITKLNNQLAKLKPGETLVRENLHIEAYHGAEGISTSKIKLFLECPAKYHAKYVAKTLEEKSKAAFDLGKAAHGLILEPEVFLSDFCVQPDYIKVRRGKQWDEFQAANEGKTIITRQHWDDCHAMRDAVARNPFGKRMLSGGKAEVSFFKRDEETDLIIKCRSDYWIDDVMVDVKTCQSSEPHKFGRHAKQFGYHIQDSLYRDVSGVDEFAFVAIESSAPFVTTAPVMFDDEARELGHLLYRRAVTGIREAMDFDLWPGYTTEPVTIGLKSWEREELEKVA